jgi:hypothetical protein
MLAAPTMAKAFTTLHSSVNPSTVPGANSSSQPLDVY